MELTFTTRGPGLYSASSSRLLLALIGILGHHDEVLIEVGRGSSKGAKWEESRGVKEKARIRWVGSGPAAKFSTQKNWTYINPEKYLRNHGSL